MLFGLRLINQSFGLSQSFLRLINIFSDQLSSATAQDADLKRQLEAFRAKYATKTLQEN